MATGISRWLIDFLKNLCPPATNTAAPYRSQHSVTVMAAVEEKLHVSEGRKWSASRFDHLYLSVPVTVLVILAKENLLSCRTPNPGLVLNRQPTRMIKSASHWNTSSLLDCGTVQPFRRVPMFRKNIQLRSSQPKSHGWCHFQAYAATRQMATNGHLRKNLEILMNI
jgi:hypothetical protein